jgi:hypothetical protein
MWSYILPADERQHIEFWMHSIDIAHMGYLQLAGCLVANN